MDDTDTTGIFLAALEKPEAASPDVGARVAAAIAVARGRWPTLALPPADFARWLARRSGPDGAGLAALFVADLYLALGCAAGLPAALQAIDTSHLVELRDLVRRRFPKVDAEEVIQGLRERLFVGREGSPPRIAEYTGRGELRSWLRVAVTRAALNASTRGPRERAASDDDTLLDAAGETESPELSYLRGHFEDELRAVFPEALAELSPRDRLLLRQKYLDHLTIEQMARVHGVHVATVKRQVAHAKDALSDTLRAKVCARLKISPSEFESVIRFIRSQFHITVQRLLPGAD